MNDHCVLDRVIGQDIARHDISRGEFHHRTRRCTPEFPPDLLSRRCKRRVCERQSESLGDDL